jgi:hypothetical protein
MIDIAIINGAVLPMAGQPVINNGVVAITGNSQWEQHKTLIFLTPRK